MDNNKWILIAFIFFILLVGYPSNQKLNSQQYIPQIVIIYTQTQERDVVQNSILTNFPNAQISSIIFSDINSSVFDNKEIAFILGTNNFALSTQNQTTIQNFANQDTKSVIVFTPFIDQINTTLQQTLGIDSVDGVYPGGPDPDLWTLEINSTIGTINPGTNGTYSGKFGVFNKTSLSEALAFMSGSPSFNFEVQNLPFPLPAIINSSTSTSQIITGSISPIEVSFSGLQLSQILDQVPFDDIITEIIETTINYQEVLNQLAITTSETTTETTTTTTPTTTQTTTTTQDIPQPNIFSSENFIFLLIFAIVAFTILFRRYITDILKWIQENIFRVFVGIVGSVYKVRNRYLSTSEVLINETRSEILDYLEYIGHIGAHFREIKSVIKKGTGNLLWHLRVLEDFGLVLSFKVDRYNIYVTDEFEEKFDRKEKKLEMEFRSKYSEIIFENLLEIKDNEELNISEFARVTSVDRKTIRKHLERLEEEEIINLTKTSTGVLIEKINKNAIENLLNRIQMKNNYTKEKLRRIDRSGYE